MLYMCACVRVCACFHDPAETSNPRCCLATGRAMPSKRRQDPARSPSASDEAKKPRSASTRSPEPVISIDSLPRHLLTEIFSYAPPAARLKAISLVCKRWRTAALHASDGFRRRRPRLDAPPPPVAYEPSDSQRHAALSSTHVTAKARSR